MKWSKGVKMEEDLIIKLLGRAGARLQAICSARSQYKDENTFKHALAECVDEIRQLWQALEEGKRKGKNA